MWKTDKPAQSQPSLCPHTVNLIIFTTICQQLIYKQNPKSIKPHELALSQQIAMKMKRGVENSIATLNCHLSTLFNPLNDWVAYA